MKVLLIVCLLAGSVAAPAVARLGETKAETARRYGNPVQTNASGGGPLHYVYESQGFLIRVYWGQPGAKRNGQDAAGRSVEELFTRYSAFSDEQIGTLLEANKGDSVWGQPKYERFGSQFVPTWRTADGTRLAHHIEGDLHVLLIRWTTRPTPPKGF